MLHHAPVGISVELMASSLLALPALAHADVAVVAVVAGALVEEVRDMIGVGEEGVVAVGEEGVAVPVVVVVLVEVEAPHIYPPQPSVLQPVQCASRYWYHHHCHPHLVVVVVQQ